MNEIHYWAAAAAIKRTAVELKTTVPRVRRLGRVKVAAERRSARQELLPSSPASSRGSFLAAKPTWVSDAFRRASCWGRK